MRTSNRTFLFTVGLCVIASACDCGGADLYTVSPQIVAAPSPLSFGVVQDAPRVLEIEIQNEGNAPLIISDVALTYDSDARFSFAGGPTTIERRQSIRWPVTFDPRTEGEATGRLVIRSNDPEHGELSVLLDATGAVRTEGPAPKISVCVRRDDLQTTSCDAPLSAHFGTVPIGETRSAAIIIQNASTTPLQILSAGVTDGATPAIEVAEQLGSQILPADGVATLDVRFTPASSDALLTTVVVQSNDPNSPAIVVHISGQGASTMQCGGISGRICDLTGQGPAVGASVWVEVQGVRHEATTDAAGDWTMNCVPEGTWSFTAENGSWSTSFTADVVGGQQTRLEVAECLSPQSARVAVVWGEWDRVQDILDQMNVPYTLFTNAAELVTDMTMLSNFDIVFFNCGWDERIGTRSPGLDNIRQFVAEGGSIYASDLAYDVVEVGWPTFIDFDGDDNIRDDAEWAPPFWGTADIVDGTLSSAVQSTQIMIDSPGTAIEQASSQTRVYIQGDRFDDGGMHPMMVSFRPAPSSGQVFFTDFHNEGQAQIQLVFQWLIQNL